MDLQELARIHAASFEVPRPWTAAEFTGMVRAPGVFVLIEDGGFIMGRVAGGEAELLTLAVDPEHQRQGLGRRLVDAFEAEALNQDADESFLEVAITNTAAIALYTALGYQQTGTRPGYFVAHGGKRIDALVMRKTLTGD